MWFFAANPYTVHAKDHSIRCSRKQPIHSNETPKPTTMFLKRVSFLSFLFLTGICHAQKETDPLLSDTAFLDYDEIFSELDHLLDSLNTPRNFSLANVTVGRNFFSF